MIQTVHNLLKYWKSILIFLLILHLSFAPPSEFKKIPTLFENEDKLIHLLMYLGLTVVLMFDVSRNVMNYSFQAFKVQLVCLAFPVLLGGLIEILQPIIAFPRTASWYDWYADNCGILLGWYLMKFVFGLLKKRQ